MACASIPFTTTGPGTSFPEGNRLEAVPFEPRISSECIFEDIVGKSPALRKVLDQVKIVAPTGSTVLLMGKQVPARN